MCRHRDHPSEKHPRYRIALLHVVFVGCGISLLAGDLAAQVQECPPGTHTVASLQEHLMAIVEAEGPSDRIAAFVSRAFARRPMPGCSVLRDHIERQGAMEEMISFIVRQNDPALEAYFFAGLGSALLHPGEADLAIPLPAVAAAVEEFGSGGASSFLLRFAEDPAVLAYLAGWARAEVGPPGRPDWPTGIVEAIFGFPSPREEALRAELRASPELIRNPRARCLVERRSRDDPPCPDPGPP